MSWLYSHLRIRQTLITLNIWTCVRSTIYDHKSDKKMLESFNSETK